MAKIADATFRGESDSYSFSVYPADTAFKAGEAVYIFTKRQVSSDGKRTHAVLYIGETDSLKERIPDHEKWPCVNRHGANCICVHVDNDDTSRLAMETDLRNANNTPCNDQ